MKTFLGASSGLRIVSTFVMATFSWLAAAQAPPGLSLQLSNGLPWLKLTGEVGTNYAIQYTSSLSDSTNWQTATSFVLTSNPYSWLDAGGANGAQRFYRAKVVSQSAEPDPIMALVPAGGFTMGDTFGMGGGDELPTHVVTVSAFHMDRYEVTKLFWDEVYQWATNHGYAFVNAGLGKAPNHPVHSVNWYDAVKWCNARSEKEGRGPAYYLDADLTQVYRGGQSEPFVKWAAGYRLPTEAEWEKAARGGVNGFRFPWTYDNNISHARANYVSGNFVYDTDPYKWYHPTYETGDQPYTSPVGVFAPNGYGIYDLAGNVWEWCWDRYLGYYYSSSPGTNPHGPDLTNNERVGRGGAWRWDCFFARVTARSTDFATRAGPENGFRAVLPVSDAP